MVKNLLLVAVVVGLLAAAVLDSQEQFHENARIRSRNTATLTTLLQDADPDVRSQARTRILSLPSDQAIPLLIQVLDGDSSGRYEAAGTLCCLLGQGRAAAVPGLIRLLRERDPDRAHLAVETLGSLRSAALAAVPELQQVLLEQETPHGVGVPTCYYVPSALVRIQGADAVPFLLEALQAPYTRTDVVDALGSLGSSAQSAVPVLEALHAESEPPLQNAIERALVQIQRN